MYPAPLDTWKTGPRAFYWMVLVAVLALWLMPIALLLNTAIKDDDQISAEQGARFSAPQWSETTNLDFVSARQLFARQQAAEDAGIALEPSFSVTLPFSIDGFTKVVFSGEFWRSMLFSFVVVIPAVVLSVGLATLAGYILAKHTFRGRILIFGLFVAGNFVPFQVLTIPVLRLMQDISIAGASPYGNPAALILFHAAFQTGFCVFFMRNFIAALPNELIEAARMEGANEFQIYFKVIVPLIRPALAALGLLIFTFVWNDFYWSLVLNPGANKLAPAMLTNLANGQWKTLWNVMAAGSIIVALPPLLFFFFLQRQFVAGLTLGANKG